MDPSPPAAATTPVPDAAEPAHERRAARARTRRIAVQVVGILAAIAGLGWCLRMAFGPNNREQWAKLGEASAEQIALVIGLSVAALLIEGLTFWIIVRPVKRLRAADVLATNALCTFLAYLPFKLSAITRFVIHSRRDGVPVPTIAAWFGNFGLIMVSVFGVLLGTLALVGRLDARWAALAAGGTLLVAGAYFTIGRLFRGDEGVEKLGRVLGAVGLGRLRPLLRTKLWRSLHAGFDMHASATSVGGAAALRWLHAAVLTWRFVAAAAIFGLVMPLEVALPLGVVFFLIGAASPAGMAGLREAGATGLAGLMLKTSGQSGEVMAQYAPVALLVSGTEALAYLVCGGLGLAWLRPDRLLKLRRAGVGAGVGAGAGGAVPSADAPGAGGVQPDGR